MRRALALAALLLAGSLLPPAVPPAEALHVGPKDFWKRLFAEGGNWTIQETARYAGEGTAHGYSYTGELTTEWSATGPVTYDPDTSILRGEEWTLQYRVAGRTVERWPDNVDVTTCTITKSGSAKISIRGIWSMDRLKMEVERNATRTSGLVLRVMLDPAAVREIGTREWSCTTAHNHEGSAHGVRDYGPLFYVSPQAIQSMRHFLAGEISSRDAFGLGYWNGEGPWPAPRGTEASLRQMGAVAIHPYLEVPEWGFGTADRVWERSLSGPLSWTHDPSDPEGNAEKSVTCDGTQITYRHTARCSWTSTLTLDTGNNWCEVLERILAEDEADLRRKAAQYPSNPTLADLSAYVGRSVNPHIVSVLDTAKQMTVLGCQRSPGLDRFAPILNEIIQKSSADLERLVRSGATTPGIREALAQLTLMGILLGAFPPDYVPPVLVATAGGVSVEVHSPVSLRAVALDGRRVGWNATANAPEVGIPNATYAGKPNGAQRLTLPPGAYRIEVEDLGPGNYTLRIAAVANGTTVREEHRVATRPGHALSLVHVSGVGSDGPLSGAAFRGPRGAASTVTLDWTPIRRVVAALDERANATTPGTGAGTGAGPGVPGPGTGGNSTGSGAEGAGGAGGGSGPGSATGGNATGSGGAGTDAGGSPAGPSNGTGTNGTGANGTKDGPSRNGSDANSGGTPTPTPGKPAVPTPGLLAAAVAGLGAALVRARRR